MDIIQITNTDFVYLKKIYPLRIYKKMYYSLRPFEVDSLVNITFPGLSGGGEGVK